VFQSALAGPPLMNLAQRDEAEALLFQSALAGPL